MSLPPIVIQRVFGGDFKWRGGIPASALGMMARTTAPDTQQPLPAGDDAPEGMVTNLSFGRLSRCWPATQIKEDQRREEGGKTAAEPDRLIADLREDNA